MKAVGITAEFDPFHNGHQYLIDNVRAELAPDAVVCVMSGNFTQRGMPAVFDKFVRAEMAVLGGADLVVELPALYAVNGAEKFAEGAIRVMSGLGVTDIAFGSECGNAELLSVIAEVSAKEDDRFETAFRAETEAGKSYAAAYAAGLSACLMEALADRAQNAEGIDSQSLASDAFTGAAVIKTILKSPNDILGLSYLREICRQGAAIKPIAVKRVGSKHGSWVLGEGLLSSSAGIRAAMLGGKNGNHMVDDNNFLVYIPEEIRDLFNSALSLDNKCIERYFDLVRYALLSRAVPDIAVAAEVGEGLENALKKAVQKVSDLNSLILAAKSKRYTYARIARCLAQLVLGITKGAIQAAEEGHLAYARVLAFNERGAAFLKERRKCDFPIYTNLNKNVPDGAPQRPLLHIDTRASDIYSVITGRSIYDHSDYVRQPFRQ